MRTRELYVALTLVGCGSNAALGPATDDDPPADAAASVDGASSDAAELDAPAATQPRCDPNKPFGTPTPIPGLNTAARDIQAAHAGELTLIFASDRGGSLDLYSAVRASATDDFGSAKAVAGFASSGGETSPFLTADGLVMFYGYSPAGQVEGDIYVATRASLAAPFSSGVMVTNVNTAMDEGDVTVTSDGAFMYLASNRPGGAGGYDLYVSERDPETGLYSIPKLVSELSTAAYEAHPRVSADGLTLIFSSMRTDDGALAGADIWIATRENVGDAFGAPVRVKELSTNAHESPTWLSPDTCTVYLQSDRAGGSGGQDLWIATKPL
jgi:hypothetical protein